MRILITVVVCYIALVGCTNYSAELPEIEQKVIFNSVLHSGKSLGSSFVQFGLANIGPAGGFQNPFNQKSIYLFKDNAPHDTTEFLSDGRYVFNRELEEGATYLVSTKLGDTIISGSIYHPWSPNVIAQRVDSNSTGYLGDSNLIYRSEVVFQGLDSEYSKYNFQLGVYLTPDRLIFEDLSNGIIETRLPKGEWVNQDKGLFKVDVKNGEEVTLLIYSKVKWSYCLNSYSHSLFSILENDVDVDQNIGVFADLVSGRDSDFNGAMGYLGWIHGDSISF